jgi:hypothetical protein
MNLSIRRWERYRSTTTGLTRQRPGLPVRESRKSARASGSSFEFTVEPFVTGGFLLSIRYSGDGAHNVTGAGVWPSVEKAKEVAEQSAGRLLHGAAVTWQE